MGKELNERIEEIEDSGTGGGVQIWVGTTDTENDTLFIVTNDSPYIRATPSSYDFGDAAVGGQSYTYTKQGSASECPFIGWFVGHTHSDEQGWITAYPNQHVSVTTRAEGKSNSDYDHTIIPDSQFKDKWNYVKVNPLFRMVTIYRVGNQQTFHGFKRDVLNYKY